MIGIETAAGCESPVLLTLVPLLILSQEALFLRKNAWLLPQKTHKNLFEKLPPATEDSLFMSAIEKLPFEAGGKI